METVATILSGIVIAVFTAYFTSRFYVHRAHADLQKEFESRLNSRKWEAYREFAELLRDIASGVNQGTNSAKQQTKWIQRFYKFLPEVWLVASDPVTNAFVQWRKTSLNAPDDDASAQSLLDLFGILIEMRRDLGYDTTALTPELLLSTFINDVETLLPRPGTD